MQITWEAVEKLVTEHGPVRADDATGATIWIGADLDSIDLVKTAPSFWFDGVKYTRQDFEKVLDAKLLK